MQQYCQYIDRKDAKSTDLTAIEAELSKYQLLITFTEKPIGCTLFRGDADIKDTNPKISEDLAMVYMHIQ